MNNPPKVSIIVPVYKVEQYIRRCLDSILVQTFTDWECLLIDDGSPDNSGKICDEYAEKDPRFRVFHKENGGVSSARKLGIQKACGDFSIHIDSDDWVEPNMLECMSDFISRHDSDILICDYYDTYSDSEKYHKQYVDTYDNQELIKKIIEGKLWGGLYHKLIRHSLYKQFNVQLFDDINYAEDALVCIQLLIHNEVKTCYCSNAFYHYSHINDNSISFSYSKSIWEMQKKYVLKLADMLVSSYWQNSINYVAFICKMMAMRKHLITKAEYYTFFPTKLSSILRIRNLSDFIFGLLAYLKLYHIAKLLIK